MNPKCLLKAKIGDEIVFRIRSVGHLRTEVVVGHKYYSPISEPNMLQAKMKPYVYLSKYYDPWIIHPHDSEIFKIIKKPKKKHDCEKPTGLEK